MIAVSAVVSYVGDAVGMKVGKKRISFFGLRPRYTSTIITVLTGIGIAVVTLGVAAGTSDAVRGALYGTNFIQREISRLMLESREKQEQIDESQIRLDVMELSLLESRQNLERVEKELDGASAELGSTREKLSAAEEQTLRAQEERKALMTQMNELKAESEELEESLVRLRAESSALKAGLAQMKEGRILVAGGELLSQVSLPGGAARTELDAAFTRLIRQAEEMIALKVQGMGSAAAPRVVIDSESQSEAEAAMASSDGIKVLRLTALANSVWGQAVTGGIHVFDRKLIFGKDEVLSKITMRGGMEPERAADLLYTFLKQINGKAVDRGVLQDPISGAVGNLDSMDFYNAAEEMSAAKGDITVTFSAATDIFTEGPVNVRIGIESSPKTQ